MVDQPADLARLLPDYYSVYGAGLDVDGSDKIPNGAVTHLSPRYNTERRMQMTLATIAGSIMAS